MIKGKKELFRMIASAAFIVSGMTTSVDAIKKDTVLESRKVSAMEVFGTSNVNIRTGASSKYSIMDKLSKGDIVIAIDKLSNGWVKVEYKGIITRKEQSSKFSK